EEDDAGVVRRLESVKQRVDRLCVADELQDDKALRTLDRVVPDRVRVALDGGEDETVHLTETGELRRDRLGLRDVEGDCLRVRPDARSDALASLLIASGDHHVVAVRDDVLRDLESDAGCAADDNDGPTAHLLRCSLAITGAGLSVPGSADPNPARFPAEA